MGRAGTTLFRLEKIEWVYVIEAFKQKPPQVPCVEIFMNLVFTKLGTLSAVSRFPPNPPVGLRSAAEIELPVFKCWFRIYSTNHEHRRGTSYIARSEAVFNLYRLT